MTLKSTRTGAAIAVLPPVAPVQMIVEDAFARVASPLAPTAAIYLTVRNRTGADDRLTGAETGAAARVEIHTGEMDEGGVMRMLRLEDGLAIRTGETLRLRPGAEHVMMLGLTEPLAQGERFDLRLLFEAGPSEQVVVTVDNAAVAAPSRETPD